MIDIYSTLDRLALKRLDIRIGHATKTVQRPQEARPDRKGSQSNGRAGGLGRRQALWLFQVDQALPAERRNLHLPDFVRMCVLPLQRLAPAGPL